jgi:hypothetical protein
VLRDKRDPKPDRVIGDFVGATIADVGDEDAFPCRRLAVDDVDANALARTSFSQFAAPNLRFGTRHTRTRRSEAPTPSCILALQKNEGITERSRMRRRFSRNWRWHAIPCETSAFDRVRNYYRQRASKLSFPTGHPCSKDVVLRMFSALN